MLRFAVVTSLGCVLLQSVALAQNPPAPNSQSEVERIKAETDLLNAQTAMKKAEQDAARAKVQEDLDRLKAQKDLLDSQNAVEQSKRQDEINKLKAQQGLIEAATPSLTGAPKGTVTVDDKAATTIENSVKAYEAVKELAPAIATGILNGRDKGTFVILGAGDVTALTGLTVFESQAALIKKRLKDLDDKQTLPALTLPDPESEPAFAPAALAIAGPLINAATSLIGLFKVDDKYAPKDETPSMRAVYGAVAAQLQGNGRSIYFPEIMSTVFGEKSTVQTSLDEVETALDTLMATYYARTDLKNEATKAAEKTGSDIAVARTLMKALEAINKELANPRTTDARKRVLRKQKEETEKAIDAGPITDGTILKNKEKYLASLKAFIDANDKYMAAIESVMKAGSDYLAALTKADAATSAPLAALIAADRLRTIYQTDLPNTYAVELGIERLAGTRKEHTNFFGTTLSFSGGVVASYRVFEAKSGKLLASDTLSLIKPFAKAKER